MSPASASEVARVWWTFIETMDYEVWENAGDEFSNYEMQPSEYFAGNWHATFWFENHTSTTCRASSTTTGTCSGA